MKAIPAVRMQNQPKPILLYDDECGVCRRIGHWVQSSARNKSPESSILVRPIGVDPEALRSLNPELDIWDAYATIHVLMPDGSMKLGGEAVAEVLRNLPGAKWFSWSFTTSLFGFRPFQTILNLAYAILADVRPLLGCESCGTPRPWLRPIVWFTKWATGIFSRTRHPGLTPHFSSVSTAGRRPFTVLGGPTSTSDVDSKVRKK